MSHERHRPQKKWGQNFLRNAAAVEKIAAAVAPAAGDLLVEIGPGEGVLTRRLLNYPNPLVAIEIDPNLAARLRRELGTRTNFRLEHADALEAELPSSPFIAVGNLPYNVANPVIRRVLTSEHWKRAIFMVQKEVADRILATPEDDAFGFFSIFIRAYADPSHLLTLDPSAFWPRPKVRSSVVRLERAERSFLTSAGSIVALASAAFSMRRKKLRNSLDGYLGMKKSEWDAVSEDARIPVDSRAEELSLGDFDRLAAVIERRARETAALQQ